MWQKVLKNMRLQLYLCGGIAFSPTSPQFCNFADMTGWCCCCHHHFTNVIWSFTSITWHWMKGTSKTFIIIYRVSQPCCNALSIRAPPFFHFWKPKEDRCQYKESPKLLHIFTWIMMYLNIEKANFDTHEKIKVLYQGVELLELSTSQTQSRFN